MDKNKPTRQSQETYISTYLFKKCTIWLQSPLGEISNQSALYKLLPKYSHLNIEVRTAPNPWPSDSIFTAPSTLTLMKGKGGLLHLIRSHRCRWLQPSLYSNNSSMFEVQIRSSCEWCRTLFLHQVTLFGIFLFNLIVYLLLVLFSSKLWKLVKCHYIPLA